MKFHRHSERREAKRNEVEEPRGISFKVTPGIPQGLCSG